MEPRKFITVLTSARHLSLSLAKSIQSPQPLPTSWRSILILPSHLRLGLPSGLFLSGFPTKTLRDRLVIMILIVNWSLWIFRVLHFLFNSEFNSGTLIIYIVHGLPWTKNRSVAIWQHDTAIRHNQMITKQYSSRIQGSRVIKYFPGESVEITRLPQRFNTPHFLDKGNNNFIRNNSIRCLDIICGVLIEKRAWHGRSLV